MQVFISYAHDDQEHETRVREFWTFLRTNGIDAILDLPAAERRQDWPLWMQDRAREARFVLVVASPAYRRRAEGEAAADEGRGVQFEAALIRDEVYRDRAASLDRIVPVVLPGCSAGDIPAWLGPHTTTHYVVSEYTVAGAERLLRLLTGQPFETVPPLGTVPALPARGGVAASSPLTELRSELLVEANLDGSRLTVTTRLADTLLCRRESILPRRVLDVWDSLRAGPLVAAERMLSTGRDLAGLLFDEPSQRLVADLLDRLPPGDWVDVVWVTDDAALVVPVELLRLTTTGGDDLGPLALRAGVTVTRRVRSGSGREPVVLPGPVKVLVAVAVPDESKTENVPLDVEAEMQAVLDAVTDLAGHPRAQVQILEVASLPQIRRALEEDAYHVLHLSAHGSIESIELEDEDGNPKAVDAQDMMDALRHAGRPVPLIVVSACSAGSTSTSAMALGLIHRGADRVIAMQAPVTDKYATVVAAAFYRELADNPQQPVGQVLARARRDAEEQRSDAARAGQAPLPEYGVPTLLAAGADRPLVDASRAAEPLTRVVTLPTGTSVRELSMGQLIGRRVELRTATVALRRTASARETWGATSGVQLVGVGGIGKTAVAGRVIARLRGDDWAIAIHDGRWNPTALIDAVAFAVDGDPAAAASVEMLRDSSVDDVDKLTQIRALLEARRLLLVFDDFEQNLTVPGGEAFIDPTLDDIITGLSDAATTGAILFTSRYPIPGGDRFLVPIAVPPLSPSQLRRLFLRLPAVSALEPEERRLLARTIGGHPRLIEFVDALLRGGRGNLRHVQVKLRELARQTGMDVSQPRPLGQALDQAMLLASADILLDELLDLLTPAQVAVVQQVAVCRAPMTLQDLAYALTHDTDQSVSTDVGDLGADVDRLTDLTVLTAGQEIGIQPWTAELVTRNAGHDLTEQHIRALAMRERRFDTGVGTYLDLLDIPRHLAHLGRYDDITDLAGQAIRILEGTLAAAAFLAEIHPLIPPSERAWITVADLELQTFIASGDLTAARRLADDIHNQVQDRAAGDPANTEWQRDLSVSHNKLGDLATAAGDLATAEQHYRTALGIRERLATADPANTEWQ
ncbi:MAG: CHAT domain-containing protein, partial [Sporichthyaceae bacterium]|nr:CHAT domain-containing protein [Sporichthyaceae bacterium]